MKSSNVLLTKDGDAKLGDVGLASMTGYFSSTGTAAGTFNYAAPELLMGMRCTSKVGYPSICSCCMTNTVWPRFTAPFAGGKASRRLPSQSRALRQMCLIYCFQQNNKSLNSVHNGCVTAYVNWNSPRFWLLLHMHVGSGSMCAAAVTRHF